MSRRRSRLWRAARAYARLGLAVAPTKPRAKAPFLCRGGFHAATTDLDQIDEWWRRTPKANIALACSEASGLVALDVDDTDDLERLLRYGELPTTPTQLSGGGGIHYLLRRPRGVAFRSRVLGVEVKHSGSIHVAPSIHPDTGMVYAWEKGLRPVVDVSIAPMPEWLITMARRELDVEDGDEPERSADAVDRARSYLSTMDSAVSGQGGHTATFRAAQAMVRGFMLDDETALRLLAEWNVSCQPPWSERELRHKVRQARRRGGKQWGYLLAAESSAA